MNGQTLNFLCQIKLIAINSSLKGILDQIELECQEAATLKIRKDREPYESHFCQHMKHTYYIFI